MQNAKAYLSEVFHSWQGEGLYVGRRQLFLRFAGCNLRCGYCDTTSAYSRKKEFSITAATGNTLQVRNPVAADTLCRLIEEHGEQPGRCRDVTLTGGEPLLWWPFLQVFLEKLGATGRRRMLETNGTLPDALGQVVDKLDVIAMDIKLPSTAGFEKDPDCWRRFLEIARACEVFLKVVVAENTTAQEMRTVASIVRSVDVQIPVVVQPLAVAGRPVAIPTTILEELTAVLSETLPDVRLIPQIHRMLGTR